MNIFSSDPFDAWLIKRRQDLNLPDREGRVKRLNSFEAWLLDAWPLLSELPEVTGFSLVKSEAHVFLSHCYSGALHASGQTHPIQCFQAIAYKTPQSVEAFLGLLQTTRRPSKVKTAAFESCLAKANDLLASLTQEYPAIDPSVFLGYFASLGGNIPVSRLSTQIPSILARVATFARKQAIAEEINIPSFHETFPKARARRRKLTAILGPTNSGKTHRAFEYLSQAKTGVYLAPLRLMAAEAWDRLRESGVRCSLVTVIDDKALVFDHLPQ
jgi:hypothetical protein